MFLNENNFQLSDGKIEDGTAGTGSLSVDLHSTAGTGSVEAEETEKIGSVDFSLKD